MLPQILHAQETDTTRHELDLNKKSGNVNIQQRFDRSMSGGMMTGMGKYEVPYETQYYHRPFKGQEYLDEAVEAYRKEMRDRMGDNWYWQFLKAVSPYIRLQLYPTDMPPMQYVGRDNPLFKSYNSKEKRQ